MEFINFLWLTFILLTGWQMILWVILLIYCLIRTYQFYCNAKEYGVVEGYRITIFDRDTHIRLYHIGRMIFDLPLALIGLFWPVIDRSLSLKVYKFKVEEKQ